MRKLELRHKGNPSMLIVPLDWVFATSCFVACEAEQTAKLVPQLNISKLTQYNRAICPLDKITTHGSPALVMLALPTVVPLLPGSDVGAGDGKISILRFSYMSWLYLNSITVRLLRSTEEPH